MASGITLYCDVCDQPQGATLHDHTITPERLVAGAVLAHSGSGTYDRHEIARIEPALDTDDVQSSWAVIRDTDGREYPFSFGYLCRSGFWQWVRGPAQPAAVAAPAPARWARCTRCDEPNEYQPGPFTCWQCRQNPYR